MNELAISDFETIYGEGFQEILLDKFIKKMEKKILKNNGNNKFYPYAFYYENENKRFKLVYKGIKYYLKLDEEVMLDYSLGIYNNITLKLKDLVDKFDEILNEEKENLIKKEIIENAKNNIIPDDNAKKIYLEYLKDTKKIKITDYIFGIWNDIKNIGRTHLKWCEKNSLIESIINSVPFVYFSHLDDDPGDVRPCILFTCAHISVGLLSIYSSLCGLYPLNIVLHYLLLSIIPTVALYSLAYIQNRVTRLISFIEEKKLTTHKINQLTEELGISFTRKIASECSLEKTIVKTKISFYKKVMNEINLVIDKASLIASKEQQQYYVTKLRELLTDYTSRYKRIDEDIGEIINLDAECEITLDIDIRLKLLSIEREIDRLLHKELDDKQIESDESKLTRKLDVINCKEHFSDINTLVYFENDKAYLYEFDYESIDKETGLYLAITPSGEYRYIPINNAISFGDHESAYQYAYQMLENEDNIVCVSYPSHSKRLVP